MEAEVRTMETDKPRKAGASRSQKRQGKWEAKEVKGTDPGRYMI